MPEQTSSRATPYEDLRSDNQQGRAHMTAVPEDPRAHAREVPEDSRAYAQEVPQYDQLMPTLAQRVSVPVFPD